MGFIEIVYEFVKSYLQLEIDLITNILIESVITVTRLLPQEYQLIGAWLELLCNIQVCIFILNNLFFFNFIAILMETAGKSLILHHILLDKMIPNIF